MLKIREALSGNEGNHIFPFLWLHGNDGEEKIREYISAINSTGVKAICIESRPHPDFVGAQWWADVDIVLDECKKRAMKVWILDDSHFPTGYAAGEIERNYPELRKQFITLHQRDFAGPQVQGRVFLKYLKASAGSNDGLPEDEIVSVVAAKVEQDGTVSNSTFIELTSLVSGDELVWDFPEGHWRIYVTLKTMRGGEAATQGYLNPLDPKATKVLIDTVYESHYQHYANEFGNTIAGFFSDEPRFGNIKGPAASIGRMEMPLPWRNDLLELLSEKHGKNVSVCLPLLWLGDVAAGHQIRYDYMDLVSSLYAKNFTQQIGDWCRSKRVEYIGHVIEDNNAHSRLGYGAGHYFRSLWGQDMAGIDVVLHQIHPGLDQGYFKSFTSTGWDGEFFHYGLAKLGSSLGHLDPKKKGRTLCEMYGAYGWGEGLKLMKWLTDHMLVRGVNNFVPHAFSLKAFPDPDCPPHFYADGQDHQYRFMHLLMNYANRVSHLLSDGHHQSEVAVLYHAESEWSGEYMPFQKVTRKLMRSQIDFNILPVDLLLKAECIDGIVSINENHFKYLVIPYSQALPATLLDHLKAFSESGFKVIFINDYPDRTTAVEQINNDTLLSELPLLHTCVNLEDLVRNLSKLGYRGLSTSSFEPYLRAYQYNFDDGQVLMLFNENKSSSITTEVTFANQFENVYKYDAFNNTLTPANVIIKGDGVFLPVDMSRYQSEIYVLSNDSDLKVGDAYFSGHFKSKYKLENDWRVSLKQAYPGSSFSDEFILKHPEQLRTTDVSKEFSGTVRLQTTLFMKEEHWQKCSLDINDASEVVEVWVNGTHSGVKLSPPYSFDISQSVKTGENFITIEVTNTLANREKDYLSQFMLIEPVGITDEVSVTLY